MKALEKYLKPDDTMADIGTGSGILAILAKKLGASDVYGCDTDETVIHVARENAEKNGFPQKSTKSPIFSYCGFDIKRYMVKRE